jgi:hypothetical protein
MKRNSLASTGLSMSQAQSISNLCNQRSKDITAKLSDINNASKTINIDKEDHDLEVSKPLPENVVELLKDKARLHATQAFLMENTKAKDALINEIKGERFDYELGNPGPLRESSVQPDIQSQVAEDWGWDQLSTLEYNEFIEAEAYASHIGQFIHKGGTLDRLRTELPKIQTLEFMEIEKDKKTPVKIKAHHKSEDLLKTHEELAALHRGYEQRVNYFKSKVKNAVTKENARISKINADAQAEANEKNALLMNEYSKKKETWLAEYKKASLDFETARQNRIGEAVNLKIQVDARFQPVVDEFLKQLEK